jgi:methylenetetrahydrofolate reductase (NADH)
VAKSLTSSDRQAADPLVVALEGLSLEIGVHDLQALYRNRHHVPENGRVYVNAVAGEGAEARINIAVQLKEFGFQPVPHIAARRMQSTQQLDNYLAAFVERADVREVLVIGGDLAESLGPYDSALDVITSGLPAKHGIARIGIAGYPDGHPFIDEAALGRSLEAKLEACSTGGIDSYIVTQFSFQADSIINWCRAVHEMHPGLHIHAGIPGPAKFGTLLRFAKICGVHSSAKKLMANKTMGLDLLRRAAPWKQFEAIGQYRIETGRSISAHLFTFGGVTESVAWLQEVRSGIDESGDDVLF